MLIIVTAVKEGLLGLSQDPNEPGMEIVVTGEGCSNFFLSETRLFQNRFIFVYT